MCEIEHLERALLSYGNTKIKGPFKLCFTKGHHNQGRETKTY